MREILFTFPVTGRSEVRVSWAPEYWSWEWSSDPLNDSSVQQTVRCQKQGLERRSSGKGMVSKLTAPLWCLQCNPDMNAVPSQYKTLFSQCSHNVMGTASRYLIDRWRHDDNVNKRWTRKSAHGYCILPSLLSVYLGDEWWARFCYTDIKTEKSEFV